MWVYIWDFLILFHISLSYFGVHLIVFLVLFVISGLFLSSHFNGFLSDPFEKFRFHSFYEIYEMKILKFDEKKRQWSKAKKNLLIKIKIEFQVSLEFHDTKTCSIWFIFDDWFWRVEEKKTTLTTINSLCVRFVSSVFSVLCSKPIWIYHQVVNRVNASAINKNEKFIASFGSLEKFKSVE